MKVVVSVKRVVDYRVKIRVKADHSAVDIDNVKMSMNPFDEIAVEEALRLKEAGLASEIIIVSVGAAAATETIRNALAMGADRGILVETQSSTTQQDDAEGPAPLVVAKILQALCKQIQPELVLLGKQSIDGDHNQTGQMLSALLGWPQATFASKLEVAADHFLITREVDGGLETLELQRPAVVTTDLRLNEPRYASLPNIMKAKKKPIETLQASDLGVDITVHQRVLHVDPPSERKGGRLVATVKELVDCLHNEAKVI